MSVSDPLVKDIKGCVQQFLNLTNSNTPIDDNNFYFVLFAQNLEKIFNQGLVRQQNTKYFNRTIDAYSWLASLAKEDTLNNFTYKNCVDLVKDRPEVGTNEGRLRLLIKCCLAKKCLHVPVEFLMNFSYLNVFYSTSSILGDEILSEIFLSVLRQVSKIYFALNLNNCHFLDTCWYVPELVALELVPCRSLGIAVSFTSNRAVIVNVEPSGVAAEDGNMTMGDVLVELNGHHIDSSSKGRLNTIMKLNKTKPVSVKIAKACHRQSGEIYQPIEGLLRDLKIDLEKIKEHRVVENGSKSGKATKNCFCGYDAKYLGKVDVGTLGSVKQVQRAIQAMVCKQNHDFATINRVDRMVSMEIGEIGLKVRDKETSDIVLDHAYMKISSCGNIPVFPRTFGYCAGEENCDKANNFICYIFEAVSFEDTDTILQSIGQGFHRTHYAV